MEVVQCIARLLLHSGEAAIPSFGVLKTEMRSATIHPAEHSFNPPGKKVFFEPAPVAADPLILMLVNQGALSKTEAEHRLRVFADQMNAGLQQKGGFELSGIGRFYYDIERQLRFSPDPEKNFLLDSFGLPSFVSKPVLRPENIPAYSTPVTAVRKKRKFAWFRF
jgi:nucleoid DNA-binding protein